MAAADRRDVAGPSPRRPGRTGASCAGRCSSSPTQGVRQFLDIGSGIPTVGNVHEIAQEAAPGARVVYVDIDPIAVAHSRSILRGNADTAVLCVDLRDPQKLLAEAAAHRPDRPRPAGRRCCSSACCTSSPDADEPGGLIGTSCATRVAPGSYLLHLARRRATASRRRCGGRGDVPRRATHITLRTHAEITAFFGGFDAGRARPGPVSQWRPTRPTSPTRPGRMRVCRCTKG